MPAKFPSIEEKFAGTEKERYLSGPCAELFKTIYNCYHSSRFIIKGLDCAEHFKEYHACCKRETEVAIEQAKEQRKRGKNSWLIGWFMKPEQPGDDEFVPEVHICPPDIVAIEQADADSE